MSVNPYITPELENFTNNYGSMGWSPLIQKAIELFCSNEYSSSDEYPASYWLDMADKGADYTVVNPREHQPDYWIVVSTIDGIAKLKQVLIENAERFAWEYLASCKEELEALEKKCWK